MRVVSVCIGLALALAPVATAQEHARPVPEIRPMVGVYVPTGSLRDDFEDAVLTGVQVGVELRESVHLLGTLGWSPNEGRQLATNRKVDLYQYDVGAEVFRIRPLTGDWTVRPFIGAGLGARTYHLRDANLEAKTYFAGYGALGAEFQLDRVALRLEGRNYVSQFKGVTGLDKAETRNDLGLIAGLAFHLW